MIRDTKSSSGTFLNNHRLSPPGQESTFQPLRDGDTLQLGVDFQVIGGCFHFRSRKVVTEYHPRAAGKMFTEVFGSRLSWAEGGTGKVVQMHSSK